MTTPPTSFDINANLAELAQRGYTFTEAEREEIERIVKAQSESGISETLQNGIFGIFDFFRNLFASLFGGTSTDSITDNITRVVDTTSEKSKLFDLRNRASKVYEALRASPDPQIARAAALISGAGSDNPNEYLQSSVYATGRGEIKLPWGTDSNFDAPPPVYAQRNNSPLTPRG